MFSAVRHVVAPFDVATDGAVIVSGIAALGGSPVILWQRRGAGELAATSAVGSEDGNATLPSGLTLRDGKSVIVAEVYFRYQGSLLDLLPVTAIRRAAFYRPRFGMSAAL